MYINQYLQKEKEKRRAENSTRISEQLMMKSLVHFTAVWNELQAMWVSFINNSNNVYKDKSFFFLSFLGGISLVSSMFLACFKISESFSLPVSFRQIKNLFELLQPILQHKMLMMFQLCQVMVILISFSSSITLLASDQLHPGEGKNNLALYYFVFTVIYIEIRSVRSYKYTASLSNFPTVGLISI